MPPDATPWDMYLNASVRSRELAEQLALAEVAAQRFGQRVQGIRPTWQLYDELADPVVEEVSDEEMAYVYESLGVKPPVKRPELPCQHTELAPVLRGRDKLQQCVACNKVLLSNANTKRRKK